jgi:hypothetical protein
MRYLITDCETLAIDDVDTYLEPVEAPSNYKDEAKIEAYKVERRKELMDKAATDIDLARIVALGYWVVDNGVVGDKQVLLLKDQTQEMTALGKFWDTFFGSTNTVDWPTLVTFAGLGFDGPLLLRRSLYLGVRAPKLQLERFKHPNLVDLLSILSLDGRLKYHSLSFYAQRFGIPVTDENTGAEIAALVAADNWAGVEAHCSSDLATTYALAKRMGMLS